MNYGEFKERLHYLLAGDIALGKKPAAVASFYKEAAVHILKNCEPLSLITNDVQRFTPYRYIDNIYFIRVPEYIKTESPDNTELDMDEDLQEAMLKYTASCCSADSNKKNMYMKECNIIIDQYTNNCVRYLENTGNSHTLEYKDSQTIRSDIPILLERYGFIKYYNALRDIDGYKIIWQADLIDKLDSFMMSTNVDLNNSQCIVWDQFTIYCDNGYCREADAYKKLESIFIDRVYRKQEGDL